MLLYFLYCMGLHDIYFFMREAVRGTTRPCCEKAHIIRIGEKFWLSVGFSPVSIHNLTLLESRDNAKRHVSEEEKNFGYLLDFPPLSRA